MGKKRGIKICLRRSLEFDEMHMKMKNKYVFLIGFHELIQVTNVNIQETTSVREKYRQTLKISFTHHHSNSNVTRYDSPWMNLKQLQLEH